MFDKTNNQYLMMGLQLNNKYANNVILEIEKIYKITNKFSKVKI